MSWSVHHWVDVGEMLVYFRLGLGLVFWDYSDMFFGYRLVGAFSRG
jgi:hypothetical protein